MVLNKKKSTIRRTRAERPVTIFITDPEATSLQNPSICKLFLFFWRVQLSVIVNIWWQVILVGLYTAGIVVINKQFPTIFYMEWTASLVPILGVVTGLILVFRTNTAYDRYYEGRRLWSQMTQGLRTLTRWIWILVKEEEAQDVIEKKSAINLLLAYAIASKHYLREEYSYEYSDLKPLISHLPKMFKEPKAELPTNTIAINYAPPTNIPLQISYYIGIYINSIRLREKWDTSVSGMLLNALNSLVECLSGFERIKRTPIPVSYSVHMIHVVWIYILSLPYQLVGGMDWWTIPAVTICAFVFFGISYIGTAIEDPFGYEANDLPLDDLCKVLQTEMNDIMGTKLPTADELYISDNYFPLGTMGGQNLNSDALSRKTAEDVKILLQEIAKRNANENGKDSQV